MSRSSSASIVDVSSGTSVTRVAPEGGDLDDLAAAEEDVGEAEAPADDAAVAEERADVLGAGARGDVEVLRLAAEEEVADAAADEVRLVAGSLEPPDDLGGVGVDAVLVERRVVADEAGAGVALERVAMQAAARPREGRRSRP